MQNNHKMENNSNLSFNYEYFTKLSIECKSNSDIMNNHRHVDT